jgi:hypothetical protein
MDGATFEVGNVSNDAVVTHDRRELRNRVYDRAILNGSSFSNKYGPVVTT